MTNDDNQILLELQKRYLAGDESALALMYVKMVRIAKKMIHKLARENTAFLSRIEIDEKAHDAAVFVIEQYKKNSLVIKKSATAYLFLCVRKSLYSITKARKLEKLCQSEGINPFTSARDEQKRVKQILKAIKKTNTL